MSIKRRSEAAGLPRPNPRISTIRSICDLKRHPNDLINEDRAMHKRPVVSLSGRVTSFNDLLRVLRERSGLRTATRNWIAVSSPRQMRICAFIRKRLGRLTVTYPPIAIGVISLTNGVLYLVPTALVVTSTTTEATIASSHLRQWRNAADIATPDTLPFALQGHS